MGNKKKSEKKNRRVASTAVIVIAAAVFCVSAVQLIRIMVNYRESNQEYSTLADDYTKPVSRKENPSVSSTPDSESPASSASSVSASSDSQEAWQFDADGNLVENAEPPVSVDWDSLKKINKDIVGWIYVDGESRISYPVLRAGDNDYYLHRTFRGESRYAGSIFMDYHNKENWSDPNTIVYGHNMRNGSMFGMLKFLDDEEKYKKDPFFWILTPKGNYRYHIFAIFHAHVDSEAYTLFSQNGSEFLAWEKSMQTRSDVKNSVPLKENDKTVMLSTCTSDKSKRCVVIGKCVSSARP